MNYALTFIFWYFVVAVIGSVLVGRFFHVGKGGGE